LMLLPMPPSCCSGCARVHLRWLKHHAAFAVAEVQLWPQRRTRHIWPACTFLSSPTSPSFAIVQQICHHIMQTLEAVD
jgi:hypothetical protein